MTEELKTIDTVDTSPFKKMVMTIGELPTSFVDSMTYYEMLAWLCNYLQNTVIPAVNNNGEAVEELQNLFIELKSYVDNYFDNLDVQEEINNKLDEMADDGTLQEIITDYLNSKAVFGYDSVADMKTATNLINGSFARTLGYYNKNSKGGAFYKIRTITNDDVVDEKKIIALSDNTLIAELITTLGLSPEQLGSKSDGTHDDSVEIQMCVNESKNTGVCIIFEKSLYYVSHGIDMPQEFSIDFQGITLRAISGSVFVKGMINCETTWNIHNGTISNLKLDQNNTATKAIYLNRSWRRIYDNIDIKNTPTGGYGIYIDGTNGGSGGNQFNHITGTGNYLNSTFIYVDSGDCVFTHIDYQQYTIGIHTTKFVRLFDIHGYVGIDEQYPDDWYTNSIFIKVGNQGSLMADQLYPDTQNYVFENASLAPSQLGQVFFTFNENTSQSGHKCVMFKGSNDDPAVFYRWRVDSIELTFSSNLLFELIAPSLYTTLSSYLHVKSITGSADLNIQVPGIYVSRSDLPMNNFTKLGIYNGNLIASGTSQYPVTGAEREICKTNVNSCYTLVDGYYPFKGLKADDSSVFTGTAKVSGNKVSIMPDANQTTNFQFTIVIPAIETIKVS